MNFLENFQEYYEENVKPYETLYRQQQYYYNKEIRRKWIFGGFFMGGALIGFATTMNPLFIPLIIVCVIWTLVSVEREKNKSAGNFFGRESFGNGCGYSVFCKFRDRRRAYRL